MNIIDKLTLRHMMMNKRRTLVTMIGIIISVAMITAVATTVASSADLLQRREMKATGRWHVAYKDVKKKYLPVIRKDANTKFTLLSKNIGYALLEGSQNEDKPYLFIKSYNKSSLKNMPIKLKEGKLPTSDNEILLSEHIDTNAKVQYHIGDKIALKVGKRYLEQDEQKQELSQNLSYQDGENNSDKEVFETIETKEYTVTGIIERPEFEEYSAPGYTVITYLDEKKLSKEDTVNVSVFLNNVTNSLYDDSLKLADKIGLHSDEEVRDSYYNDYSINIENENITYNSSLNRYYGVTYDTSLNAMLLTLGIILIVIIMIGSVSLIYNAFAISISERSKYLGMMASVGATKKQKRRSVFYEGFLVGSISIPMGIFFGTIGIGITFELINPIFLNVLEWGVSFRLVISLPAILAAIVFSIITIIISTYIPARKASKVSPIDAIRQSKDIMIHKKTVKTSKLTKALFGFEGEIALKNLKRNRKRYRATLYSLIISIILFLSVSSYSYYLKDAFRLTQETANFDISVSMYSQYNSSKAEGDNEEDIIKEIQNIDSIKEYTIQTSLNYLKAISKENTDKLMSDELKAIIEEKIQENAIYLEESEDFNFQVDIIGLDDASLKKYLNGVGVDYNDFTKEKDNVIVINKYILKYGYDIANVAPLDIKIGDTIPLIENNETAGNEIVMKVKGTTDQLPRGCQYNDNISQTLQLIVTEETIDKLLKEEKENHGEIYHSRTIYMDTIKANHLETSINEIIEHTTSDNDSPYVNNIHEERIKSDQLLLLIAIFAYGFIILITLICVANIFNTTSTSIALRKRELAMLRSIGMTPKAFHKMIAFESIFYGLKALLYGLPISFAIMRLIYNTMSSTVTTAFSVPWGSVIVAIIVVFIVVGSSMSYSMGRIKKENIIDTLKDENL